MSDLDMGHGVPEVLPGEIVAEDAAMQTTAMVAQEPVPAVREPAAMQEVELLRMQQQYALEGLMSGQSYSEAARTAGINRRTLFRWVNDDPAFRAAMEEWRREHLQAATDRLTQATEDAAKSLASAATVNFQAAAVLLKGRGLLGSPALLPNPPEIHPLLQSIPASRSGEFELRLRDLVLSFQAEGATSER